MIEILVTLMELGLSLPLLLLLKGTEGGIGNIGHRLQASVRPASEKRL